MSFSYIHSNISIQTSIVIPVELQDKYLSIFYIFYGLQHNIGNVYLYTNISLIQAFFVQNSAMISNDNPFPISGRWLIRVYPVTISSLQCFIVTNSYQLLQDGLFTVEGMSHSEMNYNHLIDPSNIHPISTKIIMENPKRDSCGPKNHQHHQHHQHH